MNMKFFISIGFLVMSLMVFGCGTSGKDFNSTLFDSIQNGHTTQEEVETMFGQPFKKGYQNGDEIWIYEHNKYKVFRILGEDTSKDMVVIFDESKVVKTHLKMTSSSDPK